MAEETKTTENQMDEMSPIKQGVPPGLKAEGALPTEEYRVGHQKIPPVLIAIYVFVAIWAAISWIPFYGY